MKRSVMFFLMLCTVLILTACRKNGEDSEGGSDIGGPGEGSVTAVDIGEAAPKKEWAYVPEFLTVGDNRVRYGDMQLIEDTACYISMSGEAQGEPQMICRYCLSDRELTRISIQWTVEEKNLEICSFAFNPDYSVWLIVNAYSADYSQLKRYLCKFDSEGKNLATVDIMKEMGRGSYVGDMAVDDQGRIYVFTSEYLEDGDPGMWLYTGEGHYHGMVYFGTSEVVRVKGTIQGEDGKFYVCISKGESPDYCTMLEVDFEGKRLTEVDTEFPNINGLCKVGESPAGAAGSGGDSADETGGPFGKYDILLYDEKYVYGYNFPATGGSRDPEELFAWADSDINGYFVENLELLADGRYFATVEDWGNEDRCIALLRKTKAADVAPRKDMVLASVNGDSNLTAWIVKFNRSQGQYHLALKDYNSLTDLYNAILTKEAMDLIDLSGVNVESLVRQGVFEDLRPYLEQSEILAPSDFVEGILDTYTIDGALVGIPESFTLRTLAGDGTILEGEDGLTLERLLEIARDNPEALPVGEVTKDEMMAYLMMFNQDTFIDWETGACGFDSPQFQAVMEFVNRFPDSLESLPGEDSLPRKIHDGQVLFAIADIRRPGNIQLYKGMFGETAAYTGFPTAEGRGGTLLFPENAFGITALSQCKEGAWKFIESVLDPREAQQMEPKELVYSIHWQLSGFPAVKKIMDIKNGYYLEDDRQWAEKGKSFGTRTYDDGYVIEFHALNQEEIDTSLALVKAARPYFSAEDDMVIQIIGEEAPAYYSGQKNLENVTKIIQNRVQLYVNESR